MHIAVWGSLGSFLLGLIVSIIRHYRIPVLAQVATAYIELSRNTPLLIQLFFLYFGLPRIGIVLSSEVCATLGLVFLGGSAMQDSGIQVLFQGNNLLRILQGLGVTIGISILSVLLSMMFGTVMGIIMTSHSRIIRFLTRLYLEFIRIMPQLVLLFIVYFGLARNFNINISGETSAIIVFTLWGTAEMGDLVRGAITSLPKHQFESGQALGLTNVQLYYHIIIPQVLRRLLPQAINLVTRMIKTTSLVVLIGVVEVTKVGQQIIDSNRLTIPTASFWIYGTILVLYFAVCYPISKLSTHLEKHWRN